MANRKVLLIGWDAADWRVARPLMDAGRMPNLRRLVELGCTASIATLQPSYSPMLWTTIATGKRPFDHGIHGFIEPRTDGRGVQRVSNLSRKCKALWNILGQNGLRSIVVGWWPSFPAEPINGVMVSDQFHLVSPDFQLNDSMVFPPELAEPLAALRVNPEDVPLEVLESFVPRASEIDQKRDRRLYSIARVAAESANIQSVTLWLMEREPWDFCAVYFDAIDHFGHACMKFHPPRQSWIDEGDFAMYSHVVQAGYELQDRNLGTLLDKAGDDTTIILLSDHGFYSDHLRPQYIPKHHAGPAVEHRNNGVFAIAGPGIRKGEELTGVGLLDITPTALALFGLPAGNDMEGRVLTTVLESRIPPPRIPSWETAEGDDGRHASHMQFDPVAVTESVEQLVALGYVESPDADDSMAVRRTIADQRANLAESYQDAGRHAEAFAILTELRADNTDDQRITTRYFFSAMALGRVADMTKIADDWSGRRRALYDDALTDLRKLRDHATVGDRAELKRLRRICIFDPSLAIYFRAQVFRAQRRWQSALDCLDSIPQSDLLRPGLHVDRAELLGRLNRWSEASATIDAALAIDPDDARAHFSASRLALYRHDFNTAAHSALNGLDLLNLDPLGHFYLSIALFRLGNPNFPAARRRPRAVRHNCASPTRLTPSLHPNAFAASTLDLPPITNEVVIVTGLPRSGTSMLMQMLAAGGLEPLVDGIRKADEDNPRGYFEFEAVKQMTNDNSWFDQARGKVVKIVAPMIGNLPAGLPCRVILIERNLDEILASQEQMIARKANATEHTPEQRKRLRQEYLRLVIRTKAFLSKRLDTELMCLDRDTVLKNPHATAETINRFLGGQLNVPLMAVQVKPELHRQHIIRNK